MKLIGGGFVISRAYPSGAYMETRDEGSDCRGGGGHHVCQEGQQEEKEKGREHKNKGRKNEEQGTLREMHP